VADPHVGGFTSIACPPSMPIGAGKLPDPEQGVAPAATGAASAARCTRIGTTTHGAAPVIEAEKAGS